MNVQPPLVGPTTPSAISGPAKPAVNTAVNPTSQPGSSGRVTITPMPTIDKVKVAKHIASLILTIPWTLFKVTVAVPMSLLIFPAFALKSKNSGVAMLELYQELFSHELEEFGGISPRKRKARSTAAGIK